MYPEFLNEIKAMNEAWSVDSNDTPKDLGEERFKNFCSIFSDELDELDDIPKDLTSIEARVAQADWLCDLYIYLASEFRRWGENFCEDFYGGIAESPFIDNSWRTLNHFRVLTQFGADDQISKHIANGNKILNLGGFRPFIEQLAEAANIPFADCLKAVMESNRTKLGADGKPIVNAQGKVEKGPNYAPPEPALRRILEAQNGL